MNPASKRFIFLGVFLLQSIKGNGTPLFPTDQNYNVHIFEVLESLMSDHFTRWELALFALCFSDPLLDLGIFFFLLLTLLLQRYFFVIETITSGELSMSSCFQSPSTWPVKNLKSYTTHLVLMWWNLPSPVMGISSSIQLKIIIAPNCTIRCP